jgi:hypothetical protein
MYKKKLYEYYPIRIVLVSNFVSLAIYMLGLLIIFQLGIVYSMLFLLYLLILELRIIRKHCINCYYWRKVCAFGKGSISALFFKKGDPQKFCEKQMSWKDMIPDMLVMLIPVGIGIFLLIEDFNLLLLFSMLLLIGFSTFGNGIIRGSLACKHCKQMEMGCPAAQLFDVKNK